MGAKITDGVLVYTERIVTHEQIIQTALEHHRAGRLREAEQIYRQLLDRNPSDPLPTQYLGVLAAQVGRVKDAIEILERAVKLIPQSAEARVNLASAFQQAGRMDDAIEGFRLAAQLRPDWIEPINLLGRALFIARRLPEAIATFRQAVMCDPKSSAALSNLGAALNEVGQFDEAIECARQVVELAPTAPSAHMNLGVALASIERNDEAIEHLRTATNLGPENSQAWNTLGLLLNKLGRMDEAEDCHRKALAIEPNASRLHGNLGNDLFAQGKLDEGFKEYEKAVELSPQDPAVLGNLLLSLNYMPKVTPVESLAWHRKFAERFESPLRSAVLPHEVDHTPGRKLRVGYLTHFFRGNPLTYFMDRILRNHDREAFKLYSYSIVRRPDEVTREYDALFDATRTITPVSDAATAEMIWNDKIDILVDLVGHVGENRLLVMAYKPAPIQVSYLGHCNTTGLNSVGYRISDDVCDPVGEKSQCTEKLVRLPSGFCCYTPPAGAPDVAPSPALRNGFVTFGSTHKLEKLNDGVIDLWCRVLCRVHGSKLLVARDSLRGKTIERLRAKFADHGVGEDRLILRGEIDPSAHLTVYHEMDVLLDAFPWSGHTTACEAMWMGVPIVTLRGDRYAGRMVASIVTQLEMCELIGDDTEGFIRGAESLAVDIPALAERRQTLRDHLAGSELCRGEKMTRELEQAYRQMWVEQQKNAEHG